MLGFWCFGALGVFGEVGEFWGFGVLGVLGLLGGDAKRQVMAQGTLGHPDRG